jgi:hypothetical protein
MKDSSFVQPKQVMIPICPVLSTGITYKGQDGRQVNTIARTPCVRGECVFWDVGSQGCVLRLRA